MRTPKEIRRSLHGPGGRGCPCCATWAFKGQKSKEQRWVRRKSKQELK